MLKAGILGVLTVLVSLPHRTMAASCSGGTIAGIVIGTMLATLLLTAVVLGVVYMVFMRKKKNSKGSSLEKSKNAYSNPSFQGDLEMQKVPQNGNAQKVRVNYIECREYDSPRKEEVKLVSQSKLNHNSKARRNLKDEFDGNSNLKKLSLNLPLNQTGSHGSLDGAMTPNDPEVVSVSLQSHDIIGLGFNISGSMSEGIFVSQVHNRGPASESGQVKVGDRILSIQISMTNMVYEDALTILSYASPYSVRLRLQRAIPISSERSEDDEDANTNISHPIYINRSQSLGDLSKINQDKWIGPRKTWSEIKKKHPSKKRTNGDNIESGKLQKWGNTNDIVHEEIGYFKVTESKSSISNVSSDVNLGIKSDQHERNVSQEVRENTIISTIVQTVEDHGTKRKSTSNDEADVEQKEIEGLDDAPPNKKSKDFTNESDVIEDKQQDEEISLENVKLDFVKMDVSGTCQSESETNGAEDNDIDSLDSKNVTIVPAKTAEIQVNGFVEEDSEKVQLSDMNENKISLDNQVIDGKFVKDNADLDNVSTEVHISESFINRNTSEISLGEDDVQTSEVQGKQQEDLARSVLKEYFGDQPNLLQQFGFEQGKQGDSNNDQNQGTDIKATNGDGNNGRKSKDYQYNTGTKGGMAYYLRFDEGFHNDFGLFNHEFNNQMEQPNLIPVPITDVAKQPIPSTGNFNNSNSNSINNTDHLQKENTVELQKSFGLSDTGQSKV